MTDSLVGTRIRQFRIVEEIGRGGMGEVFVGFDERLERKVALKSIRAEHRLDAQSKARFLREARVLSQLQHPNICQIHDYVESDEADFLVLELISGRSLTREMEDGIAPRSKIRIAEELASALVAAHGRGIVHRDLKPDNVMLTEAGQVKVLDFGLSRAQEEEPAAGAPRPLFAPAEPAPKAPQDADRTLILGSQGSLSETVTTFGSIVGTLGFMSPEQASGAPVTSASDVYSLGLILQELFTESSAVDKTGSVPERIARARANETRPVSGIDPDLTALIGRMKALATAERPTAIDARDRIRWIAEKPARRRKRILVAAAIGVLAVFAIGAATQAVLVARERNRANREAEQSRKMLEFLTGTFEVANPRKGRGPTATAREIIDHATRRLAETKGQPLLEASLLLTLSDIYREMGLHDEAEPLARRSLSIRTAALGPEHPDTLSSQSNLATVWLAEGKLAEAEPLYRRVLAERERLLGPDHAETASSLNSLATLHWFRGKYAEAEPLYRRSLAIRERMLGKDHPTTALTLNNLAAVSVAQGKLAEARPLYERSLAIRERALGPAHPDTAASLNNLANLLLAQERLAEAEPLYRRALAISEKTLGADHPDTAGGLGNLANLLVQQGKYDEAESLFRRSLAIREASLGPTHPDTALSIGNVACVLARQGRKEEALSELERAVAANAPAIARWGIGEDKDLAPLREEPRFRALVEKLGEGSPDGTD